MPYCCHLKEKEGFLLDTHGAPVPDQVLDLARYTYGVHGSKPLLLERDQNMPPLLVLAEELCSIHGEILELGQMAEGLGKELVNA